ncbi:MAG: DUF4230 domain-containing protein [Bacteroidia bacterium]|jgi:hypothetical protein
MGKLKKILWTIGGVLAFLSSIFIFSTLGYGSVVGVVFLLAGLGILVLAGILLWYRFRTNGKSVAKMNSIVVVEALKRVFKVVTAEGQFTEIVDFEDTKQRLSIFPSTKKALIIVKAHVQMGYDFSKMEWDIDEENGDVKLLSAPEPHILSINPDIKYYNLENGLFNKFNNADFNAIQTQCAETIRQVALDSELPHLAAEQAQLLLNEMARMHQWNIEGVRKLDIE